MISTQHLSKKFGKLQVLDRVDLSCSAGQCIALIGPNGCGKTTLIKCILGMVIPDSGTLYFQGQQIVKQHDYRAHIGYMPQIGRYPENMTIGQVIETIQNFRPGSSLDHDLIEAFGLPKLYDKRMKTLSGGTTQKVSAALAFMFNPDVLILDEPTAGLDPLSAEILRAKIIHEQQKGKLILITSHLLSELDDMITALIFMQDGKIKFHKPIDTLLEETEEQKISKAIAKLLKQGAHV
jgi:Cu-processing system ATP-binding protein